MRKLTAFSALIAFALTACQLAVENGNGPIKIGYIGPLTGDAASYGSDTLNAVKMKVEEVNAQGGVNGSMIELIAEDGRCTGSDSASAAQKLIHVDKVVAIVGGVCSGETLAAAPIAEEAEIVLLSPVSSSPDVSEAGEFVFRTYPSDALKTKVMAKYLEEEGLEKIAIISENTDYATALRDALIQDVGEENVVFNETVDPGTKDFRSLLTRLENIEFDVFIPNPQTDAVLAAMMQQLREQGLEQPALSQDIADSATLGDLAPEAVEGLRMINTSSLLGEGGEDSFAARFRAKHGNPQSNMSFATVSYDAAGVLLEAIGEVGTNGIAIQEYLNNLRGYNGAAGTFSFDEKGDVIGINYSLKEFKDGSIVEIRDIPAS